MRLANPIGVFALILLSACGPEPPPVPEDTYINLLAEAAIIQALYAVTADTALSSTLFQEVLAGYGIPDADFQQAHQHYQRDIRGQSARWAKARERLAAENERLMSE